MASVLRHTVRLVFVGRPVPPGSSGVACDLEPAKEMTGMTQASQIANVTCRSAARLTTAVAFVAVLAGFGARPAAAQDCGTAQEGGVNTVCGFVQTSEGSAVVGVDILVEGDNGSGSTTTDPSGFYAVSLGAGTYTVTVVSATLPPGTGSQVSPSSQAVTITSDNDVHADVNFIVSNANADEIVPTPCDFITSGGFVVNDGLKKVSFGAHGGCKNGEFWGQINVVDHASGYHINSDEITGFVAPFGVQTPTRDICGWASTNRATDQERVRFRVRLTDKGEPGSLDEFGIVLGEGVATPYLVTPRLLSDKKPGGGNVQLHKPNPSTVAPSPLPSNLCGGLAFDGGNGGGGGPE
jgi:hypothetical protein